MPVNTARVTSRRQVAYASLEELLADADRLAAGPCKTVGNWSAGQVFAHLAQAYNRSIDGFTMTFPWPLRLVARAFRKRLLTGPMPAGFKLPAAGARDLAPGAPTTSAGLAQLHSAVARLQSEPQRVDHPMLGRLTREEWNTIHLTHANLHMSFLIPDS